MDELCLDYHVPWDSDYDPHMTYADAEDTDEEEFIKFCQNHNHLLHKSLGYNTLPLPQTSGARKVLSASVSYPKRSLSYEEQCHRNSITLSATLLHKPLLGRNSCPSNTSYCQNHDEGHRPRPLSYQDICYDENDYDENSPDLLEESWSELSCP